MINSKDKNIYSYPAYHHLSYGWNKDKETSFLEGCFKKYALFKVKNILDIGCGSGLHLKELSRRGYKAVGLDINTAMAKFVKENLCPSDTKILVLVNDMRHLSFRKKFDAAICMMDTFRFLLTNEEIITHFQEVAGCLRKNGLYILEFWAPFNWKKIARENYDWEQSDNGLKVKTFYRQHFSTLDVVSQTFEDELSYLVEKNGRKSIIKGGRAKTRIIFPQEFKALVLASNCFEFLEWFSDFSLKKVLSGGERNWRLIAVLKRK